MSDPVVVVLEFHRHDPVRVEFYLVAPGEVAVDAVVEAEVDPLPAPPS